MTEQIIATIPHSTREEVRVSITEDKGHQSIGLRLWFRAKDGTMRPGKAGLSLKPSRAKALAEAITSAVFDAASLKARATPPE